jgi:hypothetical protein
MSFKHVLGAAAIALLAVAVVCRVPGGKSALFGA